MSKTASVFAEIDQKIGYRCPLRALFFTSVNFLNREIMLVRKAFKKFNGELIPEKEKR